MEWGQQLKKHQENARDAMYHNTNYSFERNKRKSLIIKMEPGDGVVSETVKLIEPLIIDKLSDVYLDSFTTHYVKTADDKGEIGFILDIDDFNIKTSTNDPNLFNKIFIPNEQITSSDPQIGRVHKGKKLNYICSINPCKLSQLTYTLTLTDGTATIAADTDFVAYAEFIIIARD